MNDATNTALAALRDILNYPLVKMGEASLTLSIVLKLLLLFALVLGTEYLLRRYLTKRLLKRTRLDASLQYGIARIGGYVFILLGCYVALTALGINLSSLAVVAGAIGVGIGFGLQNIIHNFVSGLIILVERPIALGDRIEVAGVAGNVTRIRLRSTEIVTNDNISIIVPNSDFITHPVTNWSHGDPRVQILDPFLVAVGDDDFTPEFAQARGQMRAEASGADDEDALLQIRVPWGQPRASSSCGRRTNSGFAGRAR